MPLASQQPVGQVVALQTHMPLAHAWPAAQLPHAAPPVPQAFCAVPGWHIPPASQQPPHPCLERY